MTISFDANISGKMLIVMLGEYRDRGQRRCEDRDVTESKSSGFPQSLGSYMSQAIERRRVLQNKQVTTSCYKHDL
jgi:hypothetical protein